MDANLHPDNPHLLPVEALANPQNNPQDSRWPTMIAPGIWCPMCPPEVAALFDEGQLERQHALAFVQLNPCGHLYCTRCFELLLLASAQKQHKQAPLCQAPECRRAVLVQKEPVREENVALENGEYRFEPSQRSAKELRVSIRVATGSLTIRNGVPAAAGTVKEASPVWVFMVLHTQFERLLKIVSERRRDGRLFYRVKSDGRPLDLQLVERILDGASTSSHAGFNIAVGPAHLVREARSSDEPAPFYRPSSNSNVAPPPPFLGLAQQNVSMGPPRSNAIDVTNQQQPSDAPPSQQQPAPVYGLNVDSLMGALHL